jgi:Xaa-Pro aminopeptidase
MDNFSIPDNEFVERVARVQQLMAAKGIDMLIAYATESEPAMTRYFSDFWPIMENAGVLIPGVGEPALLISMESENYARSRSRIKRVIRQADFLQRYAAGFPRPSWYFLARDLQRVSYHPARRRRMVHVPAPDVCPYSGSIGEKGGDGFQQSPGSPADDEEK